MPQTKIALPSGSLRALRRISRGGDVARLRDVAAEVGRAIAGQCKAGAWAGFASKKKRAVTFTAYFTPEIPGQRFYPVNPMAFDEPLDFRGMVDRLRQHQAGVDALSVATVESFIHRHTLLEAALVWANEPWSQEWRVFDTANKEHVFVSDLGVSPRRLATTLADFCAHLAEARPSSSRSKRWTTAQADEAIRGLLYQAEKRGVAMSLSELNRATGIPTSTAADTTAWKELGNRRRQRTVALTDLLKKTVPSRS